MMIEYWLMDNGSSGMFVRKHFHQNMLGYDDMGAIIAIRLQVAGGGKVYEKLDLLALRLQMLLNNQFVDIRAHTPRKPTFN